MKLGRLSFAVLAGVFGAFQQVPAVKSQDYPTRPITIVVPFPAGGPADTMGRILAEHMRESLGKPLIIENAAGAAGSTGTRRVARAHSDGYTLVLGSWGTHVANGAIYALEYDVVKDFEPVALLPSQPLVIVARKTMPANDLSSLIVWLRANPDTASQGTGGLGSAAHVAGLMFQKETGTRLRFVPYRGAAPIVQDLMAGQIDMSFIAPGTAVPQVRAGLITAYAVTAKNCLPIAPEIPSVDEAGLSGLHFSLWHGLWAPKTTPKGVISKLHDAIVLALADLSTRQKLAEQGFDIPTREAQPLEALGAFQRAEIEKWWPLLKAAKTKRSME